jgi:hypothetical protein
MLCTPHAKDGLGRDAMRRGFGWALLAVFAIWLIAVSSQSWRDDSGRALPEISMAEPADEDAGAEPDSADLDKDVDTASRLSGRLPLLASSIASDARAPRARDPQRPLRPPILA